MSKFQKIKNFGSSATVVSYAYFQAFKFPDSMNVHFQCVIQVCRYNCPDPVCPEDSTASSTIKDYLLASQATVTVAPVFSSNGQVSDFSAPAPESYVVNGGGAAPLTPILVLIHIQSIHALLQMFCLLHAATIVVGVMGVSRLVVDVMTTLNCSISVILKECHLITIST